MGLPAAARSQTAVADGLPASVLVGFKVGVVPASSVAGFVPLADVEVVGDAGEVEIGKACTV
jgi:hypothetical protein